MRKILWTLLLAWLQLLACSAPAQCKIGDSSCALNSLPLLFSRTILARFLFSANQTGNNLNVYRISQATGQLTSVGTIAAGTYPTSVGSALDSRFVYVSNQNSNDITQLIVDPISGAPTANGSLTIAGGSPQAILIPTGGQFGFSANYALNNLSNLVINSMTGQLTQSSVTGAGTSPQGIVFDSTQSNLFSVNFNSNNVSCFSVTANGGISLSATVSTGGGSGPFEMVIHPNGRFAYVSLPTLGQVSVHSITNGVLSSSLATYGAGTSNKHIVIHPSGSFVYAVNFGSSNISIFTVQSNGLLSGPTNVTTPANPLGFVFEPGGKYAYGAGGLSTITTYSVDSTTGSLTAIGTTNSGTGSSSLSVGLFSTF